MSPLCRPFPALDRGRPVSRLKALGIDYMTIGIAAIVPTQESQIVTVSDSRVSFGDGLPSTDDAIMKNSHIAPKWGMLFAADQISDFSPVIDGVRKRLNFLGFGDTQEHEVEAVRSAVRAEYEKQFSENFFREHLARFGYEDISDFRRDGFSQMGKDLYHKYAGMLAEFDLGLELLIYGFHKHIPYLFEVANPGKILDRNLSSYAAIGTGSTLAYAALNRKRMPTGLEETIYRLLDAKFSSETASHVGKKTHVITMNREGKIGMMRPQQIDEIRKIWDDLLRQPEPQQAIEIIGKSRAVTAISDGER